MERIVKGNNHSDFKIIAGIAQLV